jgi:hypothetical protein
MTILYNYFDKKHIESFALSTIASSLDLMAKIHQQHDKGPMPTSW